MQSYINASIDFHILDRLTGLREAREGIMKNNCTLSILLFSSILVVTGQVLQAQATVQIQAMRDNTLYQDASGALSNGAGEYLFTGKNGTGNTRRAVIAFDIAGNIPEGSAINSVSLHLNMSRTAAGEQTVSLHRITADWGEGNSDADEEEGAGIVTAAGDATWLHRFYDTDLWENQGGDFVETASSHISIGDTGKYNWTSTKEMVADVQLWLNDGARNFGWLLKGNESGPDNHKI